ncbi:DUF4037 domain-containing protein [Paenibacillus tepidiphilus]|uniref:DUF4037 domain-containing protein n=1 Tax=Paenibacillus tepidiphilus TaxID=2608683 RepID=UPI00123BB337|nr:DUF4037 domain-containing protein [Paenibacillus tepidiphilus]
MPTAVVRYFENAVMPMIRSLYPEAVQEMSILILGSVGLGIDDVFSDLEAAIYLNDHAWHAYGGQLQLSVNRCLADTNPWRQEGSVLSVLPVSWLLDGQSTAFLEPSGELPWEQVSFESLFTLRYNLIFHDPQGLLRSLREAAAPSRYPEPLWKKALLGTLHQLIAEDLPELRSSVLRERQAEAHISFGRVVEGMFRLVFAAFHQYYPWRTHLRWAMSGLPVEAAVFVSGLDELVSAQDWKQKVTVLEALMNSLINFISLNQLLPGVDLYSANLGEELLWAQRLGAWKHPDWHKWIDDCTSKAIQNGYSASQFWVWSLWGWEK